MEPFVTDQQNGVYTSRCQSPLSIWTPSAVIRKTMLVKKTSICRSKKFERSLPRCESSRDRTEEVADQVVLAEDRDDVEFNRFGLDLHSENLTEETVNVELDERALVRIGRGMNRKEAPDQSEIDVLESDVDLLGLVAGEFPFQSTAQSQPVGVGEADGGHRDEALERHLVTGLRLIQFLTLVYDRSVARDGALELLEFLIEPATPLSLVPVLATASTLSLVSTATALTGVVSHGGAGGCCEPRSDETGSCERSKKRSSRRRGSRHEP